MGVMERYEKKKKGKSSNATTRLGVQDRYELRKGAATQGSENSTDSSITDTNISFDPEKGKIGWQKYLDDRTSINQQETEDESFWDKLGRWLGPTGATDTTLPMGNTAQLTHQIREDTSYTKPSDNWSDEQRYEFGALYLESPEKAYAYAEKTNNANNRAKEEAEIKKVQDSAISNGWAGAAHTAGAIASAGLGLADYLNMLVLSNAGRDPLESDGVVSPFEYSTAVTEGIGTHLNETYGTLDEDIPIFGGKGWGDVYGLGTSIAQSAASGYALGPAGTLVSYFGQGAASGMKDALERGASEWQAARYGAALGAFEGVAESIGIDNLFKLGSSSTIKGLLKNILQQAKAEGLEEGFTSVLSNIADAWIMQDKSNFNAMLNAYMEAGMSEKDAKWAVFWDSLEGIAFDMIAGAASGGIHGGLQTGIQTGKYSSYVKNAFGGQTQDIVNDALNSPHSSVQEIGQKYQEKLDSGKSLSGWNLYELLETTDSNKIKDATLKRLGELGETSDVTAVAEVLVKQAMGQELSSKDQNILNNSKYGNLVSTELMHENILSDGLFDKWSENIGTRMVSPEVYNKGKNVVAEDFPNKIVTKGVPEEEIATEAELEASEEGDATLDDTISIMNNMVEKMELSDDVAGQMLEHFKPSDVQQAKLYQHAVPLAYNYGKIGYSAGLRYITSLSEQDKNYAYRRGAIDALIEADSKQSQIESSKTGSAQGTTKKKGIIYEGGYEYKEKTATPLQKSSMKAIEVINAISNLEIHVFESVEENGKRVYNLNGEKVNAPNGYFKDGNKIYIDINAGQHGEGLMLDTLGHEVTHYIRENDAKGFKAIADFLIEQYGKKGVNVEALLESQRKKIRNRYAREGEALPSDAKLNDMAYEELVADAMSEMLSDPKAYDKLAKLKQQNRSAWETLRDAIKNILDKIKSILDQYKSEKRKVAKDAATPEANAVRDFSADAYEKLQDLYIKAFVEADANYEASEGSTKTTSEDVKHSDRDSEGNELSTEQIEFFKDSKVRDANGNLLVMYHGTNVKRKFYKFNTQYRPAWFTSAPGYANAFTRGDGKKAVYEVYLNVTKPLYLGNIDGVANEENLKHLSALSKIDVTTLKDILSEEKGEHIWRITNSAKFKRLVKKQGYDGFVAREGGVSSWATFDAEQAKSTDNIYPSSDPDIRYSDRDSSYLDAVNRGDMVTAQKMVDEAAREVGYTVKAYHGTSRGDRVGNVFLPERATSGPMAFFTDNKDIADNYARNKADTSLAYDTEYDSYYTQFRVNHNGKNIPIPELWKYLSFAERNSIKEKAKHIKFDDDYESIIVDSTAEHGNGAWDAYTLNMHKGNALEALVDTWLETGDLLNREADFIKVLELVGLSDVEYRDPDARHEKVYDTWLKIQKPFDTDNANQSFYDSLSEWIDNHDMSVYEKESSNADFWDKNNQSPESWLDKLSHDIGNGTTHAWTVIPDFVTDYLKEQGYNGIKDKGGKGGGAGHTVWIPFSSEQIKSAEPITYDDGGNVIPLSERFDAGNNDIRYSDRNPYSYEVLISKPDMKITTLDGTVPNNRADVVFQAKKNAASVGKTNKDGGVLVHVDDTNSDVLLSTDGLKHGLRRTKNLQTEPNAIVTLKAGEILKNSIRINELTPSKVNAIGSYVLIGSAKDSSGNLYIVRSIVNQFTAELTSMDVLYAINTKKESAVLNAPRSTVKLLSVTDSTISIAHLLGIVNRYFPDILPESVLRHYGYDARPDGELGENVLYSDRRSDVSEIQDELERLNIETKDVISLADGYFKNYGGAMNRSEIRYAFLRAIKIMSETTADSYEQAFEEIVRIADELSYNPKVPDNIMSDLKEMKNHIRGIRFRVHDVDKPEFYKYGGFGEFRKMHMGKLTLTNDGISVDSVYKELQGLYGTSWFPDVNTVSEQLMQIANVVDTDPASAMELDYDPKETSRYTVDDIVQRMGDIISASWNKKREDKTYKGHYINYRDTETISNRTLLANALDSVAKNDIEKNRLNQYKSKIALIESEQAKLSKIRAELRELYFTKGRRDTDKIKSLQFEATQIENRINTYDRQLLKLESTEALKGVLDREKKMAYKQAEQRGKESLQRQKEKDAATVRELMTRNYESRKKATESRNKTAMREKIRKVVNDLNKLLLNPTQDKHVPIGLQKVVAEALDVINMDTMNAEERVAYYNDLISKSNNPDEIAMLKKKRDFFEYRDMNFKDRITSLKSAYAEFKESDDSLIRNAHNDAIEDLIKNTADEVGNKSLKDMSLTQLEKVYDMYKAILATVRNTNKMFKEGRQETVTENSNAVKLEVREVGGHKDRVLKMTKFLKKFGWEMLKPVTAMKVIGSKTFERLFNNVRAAEDTWALDVNEAKQFYEDIAAKYGYNKWDLKKFYSLKDGAGADISMTLEQIMSLYAYSKREQADQHLEFGGFIFDDAIEVVEKNKILGIPLKYEVNDANPHRLRKEHILDIISVLTKEQKDFVDAMQTYLSDVMGAKGNEVSLAMYDIKLYKEKNYFPLKTSRYFREFDPEKSGTPKIKNSGFSKKTVPQAGNPIVLSNFMDVWAGHVNDMSMYHAFVLPLEDFMRVYNYSLTAGGYDSVQQYIKNAYGSQANQYIERLLDDLNGGARVGSSAGIINKGLSLFKKASVFASASVVVQQPSAMARALAYIHPKYFAKATPEALNIAKHKTLWAEVKKYAPVAIIKEMGYFDTGVGRGTVEWIKGNQTFMDKMDDVLSKAPAIADELCWTHIWEAIKRETQATSNLKVGSEIFLIECGKRFTEVITNTQVYDSVLSRSGMMRSKDTGMKMATAFMAEPTTTVNMMVDGIIQGKRGNKRFTTKTVGAVASSIILNSILVALVYAARDDDEDETYLEKYIGSLTSELLDGFNPLTYIPFVKDIWSIAQGYDVERSDMSVVSNLWESIEGLFDENTSGLEKVTDTAGAIASLFGIPLKNILRDAKGMYNLTQTILSDTPTTGAGIGEAIEDAFKSSIPLWDRLHESDSKADRLYKAIMSGDQDHIDRVKATYKSEQAYETALKSALRENDSRIHEAAQARLDGNISEYTRIAREIIAEGHFSQDTVVAAINSEMSAIKKGEPTQTESTDSKDEVTSIYRADDINVAFDNGDTSLALSIIDELVEMKMANGMDEKKAKSSLRSSMTSYWKPLYKQAYASGNTAEMQRIKQILYKSGLYGSATEVIKDVNSWLKN